MRQRCLPDIPKANKVDIKLKINHIKRRSISTGVSGQRQTIKQDQSVYIPSHTAQDAYGGMRPNRK